MKEKIMKLPVWLVVVIGILAAGGFLAVLNLSDLLFLVLPELPGYGRQLTGELLGGIYALLLLCIFGYAGIIKEKGVGFLKGFYIGGFMVGYCMLVLVAQIYLLMMSPELKLEPVLNIVMFLLTMFLIGWGEEMIFRGLLLNLFLDRFPKTGKGILGAIILDGVLFGAIHLTNIFSGVSVGSAVVQAINASLLGIVLAAIYARSRNIWIVIIAHAMTDLAALLGSGFFGQGSAVDGINQMSYVNLLAGLMLLIPCAVLLRKSKLSEMEQRANGMVVFETYQEADNIATTSLILGILGMMFGTVGYGIGISITGLLGSCISKKIKPQQNGIATAGLVLSIIGLVINAFMVVVMSIVYHAMNGMFSDWMM